MLIKTDSQNYADIADAIRYLNFSADKYKPEEMASEITRNVPEYAVSYDTFDENGNALSVTVYGHTLKGLGGLEKLQTINIRDTVKTIGSYVLRE